MLLAEVVKSDNLMNHRIVVEEISDRRAWLTGVCSDRSVLHFGCCDVPVFEPDNNLHIELSRCTERIDGLDISPQGISILKQHVHGDYFSSPDEVSKHYDIVLVPEVIEHTPNPQQFLQGVFSILANEYIITAPHISWYEKTHRVDNVYWETVHEDHRAWYSPYTLLQTLRPFIDEQSDHVAVYMITEMGSIAVCIQKSRKIEHWSRQKKTEKLDGSDGFTLVKALVGEGHLGEALFEITSLREKNDSFELFYLHADLLMGLKRNMDLFRIAVGFMQKHPADKKCLLYAAHGAEGLGQHEQAAKLRKMATG